MTVGGFPNKIEARTLAARGRDLAGEVALERMPRLQQAILGADGPASAKADFSRDEEGRYLIDVSVSMAVTVPCQRCLQPMRVAVSGEARLAILWTDDQAAALPEGIEPLVTGEETDLWAVAEDELLLALPPFSYHNDIDCAAEVGIVVPDSGVKMPEMTEKSGNNPFSVLSELKKDQK
ncbi:conserved hypothetical protein [Luminiphilus syltensis NOR5-1B]|uniref:Large ribosomal RNA subunit accumulation protein YceD n=1 Tax=Luminiphilus syltensis NOR5-1B TaxID=565045 RepID=B8KQV8_9GAMM|nr:YceD family protein [Luminiphilus syltensis]EED36251.1 conserved hypothetical protein [Luminiphilus syltensis NOR5-1B]